ncbi:hypothetical protein GCM10009766_04990 [Microcella frigidaquae]
MRDPTAVMTGELLDEPVAAIAAKLPSGPPRNGRVTSITAARAVPADATLNICHTPVLWHLDSPPAVE